MEPQDLTIPLRQIINVVTLTQSMIFAAFFLGRPARTHLSTWFLVAAFLVMATVKGDQLYQMLGGFEHYPQYGFVLAPIQAAMTPVLYLFVVARTTQHFMLRRGHLWHLTPLVVMTLYLTAIYYRLDISEKVALIESDGLNTPLNRLFVPLLSDAVQLCYLLAAYTRLQSFGVTLRNWFAQVEDRDLVWMKRLLTIWGCVFVFHAAMTLSAILIDTRAVASAAFAFLDVFHLVFVNLLALLGAADLERRVSGHRALPPAPTARYSGSAMTPADRAALYRKAENAMAGKALYLQPDLTLSDLAHDIAAAPRDVSEAINGAGGQSFYDFVNAARIGHAKSLLIEEPDTRVLDIAFQAGFNSKSTFNDAFKKTAGVTPTEFRRTHSSSPQGDPSGAKPA